MGNPAGVRRDFDALENRRFEAIALEKEGLNQTEVARRLKVSRQTVARWMRDYRLEGKSGLKKAGRAGRKPRLTEANRIKLEKLLLEGPERPGYETPLWTCPRVAHLIVREFGISYHQGHVWKVLIKLGWTPQRPPDEPANKTKNRSAIGREGVARHLKKPYRKAYDRLHR
jgi:transposase